MSTERLSLIILLRFFCVVPFFLNAQEKRFELHPVSWEFRLLVSCFLDSSKQDHSSVWPQKQSDFGYSNFERLVYNGEKEKESLDIKYKDFGLKKIWRNLEKKVYYEDFYSVEHEDFSIYFNYILNLSLGFDRNRIEGHKTFLNTRGFIVEGRLGKKFSFQTIFMEQQAYFPKYQSVYFNNKGSSLGLVMHRGYKNFGFDFPFAVGEISYNLNKFFNISAGHGSHFFGEGYRSMLLSDHTVPYGYLRLETNFWKLRYINLYALLNDINPATSLNGIYAKKFASIHYLDISLSKRWNFSIFESYITGQSLTTSSAIDINFLNPIIFYRALEANRGFELGNAMVGLSMSYQINDNLKIYSQLAIDDFMFTGLKEISQGHRDNYHSWQIGSKYFSAIGVNKFTALIEVNSARPFMYSHRGTLTNYESQGLPLAHPWETNFRELVILFFYKRGRWEFLNKVNIGKRGMDTSLVNMGNDIRRSYEDREDFELGYFTGGPVSRDIFYLTNSISYVINPITNMRLELKYIYRKENFNFLYEEFNRNVVLGNSNWISFGIRTALFWGYEDF